MNKILVGALLGSSVLFGCSKSDMVTPVSTSTSTTEKLATLSLTQSAKVSLPLNGTSVYIKDVSTLKLAPGDTIVIPKSVTKVALYNVRGASGKPIVVTAAAGAVIGGGTGASFDINGAYIKVVNVNIKGLTSSIGFKAYYTTDLALENVNIDGASIGVMIKNDPLAGQTGTYYPTTIKNISLTNVSVKNTGNEGYYLGNTADYQSGYKTSPIIGLTVTNVKAENTGWDGFQITSAQNCRVNGVSVTNAGTANKASQMNGITLQDATTGTFQNLSVNKSTGPGLNIFGCGNFTVDKVTLKDVVLTAKSYAIFVDNRPDRFNLPAKKLIMSNVSVTQTSVKGKMAMYVVNGTANGAKAAIPGTVTNLTYSTGSWTSKVVDYAKNVYVASQESSTTTPATNKAPSAPANFNAIAGTGKVTLTWSAPLTPGGTITGYKIYRGTIAGNYNLIRTTTGSTFSYVDGNKASGTSYYYVVRAVNATGEGSPSAAIKVRPQ